MLVIASQDIGLITLALVDGSSIQHREDFLVPPEGHLAALDTFLSQAKVDIAHMTSVLVVTGPGSFTASRVSTTLANAIGFTKNLPVYGVENPAKQTLEELVEAFDLTSTTPMGVVQATYDRPPTITSPKKG